MKQINISVVICTYNRAETLRRALQCVVEQETNSQFYFNIIVVDDGSTDHTAEVVKDISSKSNVPIRYVHKEGGGIADARNRGIQEADAKFIVFCDDDTFAKKDWLGQLYKVVRIRNAECVAGRVLLDLPQEHYDRLGPIARGLLAEYNLESTDKCTGKHFPPTCNLLISLDAARKIQGFDTSMVNGGEDTDFLP